MKKVGILTTFFDLKPSYSLASVVKNQLEALLKHGYTPILFVLPSFCDDINVPKGVEVRKVVPQLILEPYAEVIDNLDGDMLAKNIAEVTDFMQRWLLDIDVVITHDWMLVDTYSPYAAALHFSESLEEVKGKKWLHWIHSFPSAFIKKPYPWSEQYEIPKGNHKIVYLNNTDVIPVFERYQSDISHVGVVHNPVDPRTFFRTHPLVTKILERYDLLDKDIVQIYPLSTPRMVSGKQVHRVLKVFSEFKKLGKKVCLIICNAHANAEREKELIKGTWCYAEAVGLTKDEVVFTSMEEVPEWEHGVPHEVVRDLFLLSNVFIFPTVSENAPLILLEAAATKNLLVLNDDFLPLREFFGENALYFKFGSLRQKTEYADEDKYFEDMAKIIISELRKNTALNAFTAWKQKFNYDYLFINELEPLLMEGNTPDGLR